MPPIPSCCWFRAVCRVWAAEIDHYAPITRGTVPERLRTDHNPLDRKEYLLNVAGRAGDRRDAQEAEG